MIPRKATAEEAARIIAELTTWVDRLAEETNRAQALLEDLRQERQRGKS